MLLFAYFEYLPQEYCPDLYLGWRVVATRQSKSVLSGSSSYVCIWVLLRRGSQPGFSVS
jgi:hypothetical protein